MFLKIKNKIEKEIVSYIRTVDRLYSLSTISPVLYRSIKDFISRKGKRIRPTLFAIGYLGFAKKTASGLYRSAVSLELLHDFMLVHDDIIDKSEIRRGKPSMHAMLNNYLLKHKNLKFSGQDLTIVAGDVMYAMALDAFTAIREDKDRKERALKKLITAALYTGSGEFIELINGTASIEETKKKDIFKIYDLKTANYTFASPLSIGATLAGASQREVNKLFQYGIYLGRAFQIKDDIIGIFSKESEIGKSNLTDLNEGKKTLLVWLAYRLSNKKDKLAIQKILTKKKVTRRDLLRIRKIIIDSQALEITKRQVRLLIQKALRLIASSKIKPLYKKPLHQYAEKILSL